MSLAENSGPPAQQPGHYTDIRTENTYLQDDSVKSLKFVLFRSWSCCWGDSFYFYPPFITSYTHSYMQCPSKSPPSPFPFIYLQSRLKDSPRMEHPQINSCYSTREEKSHVQKTNSASQSLSSLLESWHYFCKCPGGWLAPAPFQLTSLQSRSTSCKLFKMQKHVCLLVWTMKNILCIPCIIYIGYL